MRITLLLSFCLTTWAIISVAQTPVNPFSVDDQFVESDLRGHLYAFSTKDSTLGINNIIAPKHGFRLLHSEIPTFGNDNRYHWIRATIRNAGQRSSQIVSYLHQNELADVCFYVVRDHQVVYWQEHLSQRTYTNQKPIATRYFAFPVDIKPQQQVDIYWRVFRDENSVILPFKFYSQSAFNDYLITYDSLAFLCLGVLLSAFLLSFILLFVNWSWVLFYYAFYCLFYFLLCISNDGIILQYFHIDPFEMAVGFRICITGLMMLFLLKFTNLFLKADQFLWKPATKLGKCLAYFLPAAAFAIAIFSLGESFISIFYLLCTFSLLLMTAMIIAGILNRNRESFFYLIAVGPFFASNFWYAASILLNTEISWFYLKVQLFVPIIEMVVLGIELGSKLIRDRDTYYSALDHMQRELTTSILKTQDTERRRIASDLHDELGGTLATIRLKFASLRRSIYLNEELKPVEQQAVEEIEPLIHKSNTDLRRIAQTLMPPEFERIGLLGSIQHIIDSLPANNPTFTFISAGPPRMMSTQKELAIYRIATETIQYVGRRDLVSRGSAQLLYFDEHLQVVIEADENITTLSTTKEAIHQDLSSCSLLAAYLNGSFCIEISLSGILVIAEIPY